MQHEQELVDLYSRLSMEKESISKMEPKINKQVKEIEKLKLQMSYLNEKLNEKVSDFQRLVKATSRSEIYGGGFDGNHQQHGMSSEITLGRSHNYDGGFSENSHPPFSHQDRGSYHGGFTK